MKVGGKKIATWRTTTASFELRVSPITGEKEGYGIILSQHKKGEYNAEQINSFEKFEKAREFAIEMMKDHRELEDIEEWAEEIL